MSDRTGSKNWWNTNPGRMMGGQCASMILIWFVVTSFLNENKEPIGIFHILTAAIVIVLPIVFCSRAYQRGAEARSGSLDSDPTDEQ
jgi:hypothetical protein